VRDLADRRRQRSDGSVSGRCAVCGPYDDHAADDHPADDHPAGRFDHDGTACVYDHRDHDALHYDSTHHREAGRVGPLIGDDHDLGSSHDGEAGCVDSHAYDGSVAIGFESGPRRGHHGSPGFAG